LCGGVFHFAVAFWGFEELELEFTDDASEHSLFLVGDVALGFVLQHLEHVDACLGLCQIEDVVAFIVWDHAHVEQG